MKIITESEMNFGKYTEDVLFHIEDSKIYQSLGDGIKTVEFILKYGADKIIFLEAKTSCPNSANHYESNEKKLKFEEYYSDITEKFIHSLQIYLAILLDRYENTDEIGIKLLEKKSMDHIHLKFILVVKEADTSWLAGPLAELKARLLPYRKIWGIDIAVLNEDLARQYQLIC